MNHTATPWQVSISNTKKGRILANANTFYSDVVCTIEGNNAASDVMRIALAVNATDNISNEALGSGVIDNLINAAQAFVDVSEPNIYPKPDKPESDYGCMCQLIDALKAIKGGEA